MPLAGRTLTMAAAELLCTGLFEPATEQRVGLELEWPVHACADARRRPTEAEMALILHSRCPAGGRVTFEPGGQVELSSAPQPSLDAVFAAVHADEEALMGDLGALGLTATEAAVDDTRSPQRVLQKSRYEAMERFFAAQGPAGCWMMCNTASTQINISHDAVDPAVRWRTMHLIAPLLIAAFANSPGVGLDGQRWASLRQGIWCDIDLARTRPVRMDLPPAKAWLEYALDADVMFVNRQGSWGSDGTALLPGLTFGAWMSSGHELGWPTIEDLRYHLSTLFPPVRPRGWLELRVLDALPEWIRTTATLVVAAAADASAGRDLQRRLPDTSRWWRPAAQAGLTHPAIADAVDHLFAVAADHLAAVSTNGEHHALLDTYRRDIIAARRSGHEPEHAYDLSQFAPALT